MLTSRKSANTLKNSGIVALLHPRIISGVVYAQWRSLLIGFTVHMEMIVFNSTSLSESYGLYIYEDIMASLITSEHGVNSLGHDSVEYAVEPVKQPFLEVGSMVF